MQGMLRCDTMYLIELSKERAMAATSMVHVRVDDHIKTQATETLAAMGLTVSDAIRVFLTRVVADRQLPFALQAPNPDTRAAMEEARAMSKARFASARALINDLEKVAKQ
jgi:DNA-damage-inducible protein J